MRQGYPARRGPRVERGDSESEIQREIRLAAGRAVPGCVLFRNNCGVARHDDGAVVRYGVGGNGGADLIGWLDVGSPPLAIFLAVEVKTKVGRLSPEQKMFGGLVSRTGVFIVARSVDDFVSQALAARERLSA